jgi:putative oxygen-independent coproporphyrinogen III oxidase
MIGLPDTTDPVEGWLDALALLQPRQVAPTGIYVHVPYCSSRCGYCDFNTYTPREIDLAASDYAQVAIGEIRMSAHLWQPGRIDTVFLGGGTPTLLEPADIAGIITAIDEVFGLAGDAEVTIEANPDSVTATSLRQIRDAGVTRVSFGVQSLASRVLATLDRTHTPGRALAAIADAQQAGFEHISADLIYATPGETDDDLAESVRAVVDAGVDHLSAYSLIIEPGTRMAHQVRSGVLPAPDDDIAAHRYAIIDSLARAHSMEWYEVSNWAKPGGACRHNLGYWRGGDWWAIGPGAHAHIAGATGLRWWNIKHPRAHADAVADGRPPVAGWERIDESTARVESLMLGLRMREGIARSTIAWAGEEVLQRYIAAGMVVADEERVRVSDAGRLLVDALIRDLVAAIDPG